MTFALSIIKLDNPLLLSVTSCRGGVTQRGMWRRAYRRNRAPPIIRLASAGQVIN